eukprot:TRINITY_DN14058_c0_g1_i1.p1 TRINITY_DN14058_c0_g1~~TRINITY_DN14058_c0_g1_i1.p1  ORF type:complete len:142 (+),score=28.25 TRINITY_DN14058_c0_g1_i1:659-1084(+)
MAKELKAVKEKLAELIHSPDFNHIENAEKLKDQIEIAKETIEKLSDENELLRQALKSEQKTRVARTNELVALKDRLKKIQKDMKRCEDTRYNLSVDIQTLQANIQRLTQKLGQSEQLCQMYVGLFRKAGFSVSSKCVLLKN